MNLKTDLKTPRVLGYVSFDVAWNLENEINYRWLISSNVVVTTDCQWITIAPLSTLD